jgi:hypothetical protein
MTTLAAPKFQPDADDDMGDLYDDVDDDIPLAQLFKEGRLVNADPH